MPLYFSDAQQIPQTHILIIGVGNYPYLKGGRAEIEQRLDFAKKLEQLTSPPQSAKFFLAEAMDLHKAGAFAKPLGSIEILTDRGTIPAVEVQEPTLEHITEAYFGWKDRCNAHPDNVAVFYFAGHGVGKTEHYLLPSDFGRHYRNPQVDAFAFDETRAAFHHCKAKTQLFLIDACRLIPTDTLLQDFRPLPIDVFNHVIGDCSYNLTIKAASHNQGAYGEKEQPSFFIKALMRGLKGGAAVNEEDRWTVSTGDLAKGINKWLAEEKASENYPQRCNTVINDSCLLLVLPQPPEVLLHLSCNPGEALPHAAFLCEDPNGSGFSRERSPDMVPWEVTVPAGIYRLRASFPENQFSASEMYQNLTKPQEKKLFTCQKR